MLLAPESSVHGQLIVLLNLISGRYERYTASPHPSHVGHGTAASGLYVECRCRACKMRSEVDRVFTVQRFAEHTRGVNRPRKPSPTHPLFSLSLYISCCRSLCLVCRLCKICRP